MAPTARRRVAWIAVAALAALLLAAALVLLRGERLARFALDRAGEALGLEIVATGGSELTLRGMPTLVVRDVVARVPGTHAPVLSADRALLSLPWSTLRGRLRELDFTRVELDAPVLHLEAFQAWLASRPPGDGRVPTLREGIVVEDGTVLADGWRISGLDLVAPLLHADRPLRAHATGRYLNGDTALPFDLHGVLARPAPGHAVGIAGLATVERPGWRIPARVRLGGTWQSGDGGWGIARMKLGANAAYATDESRAPFALGLFAPLRVADGRTTLAPLHLSLLPLGDLQANPIPRLAGAGDLALDAQLVLSLDGALPSWPAAWPVLPAPLDDADARTAFALRYAGDPSLADVASLDLARDGADADTRLRLAPLADWMDTLATGTPLPPVDGTARIARLEIGGATLHDVELVLDDPMLDGDAPAAPAE